MDYSGVNEVQKQMQNLFKNINELQQQIDQSRQQEVSPIFCDSSVRPNHQTFSQSSIHSIKKSNKKELILQFEQLKKINRKLFEDNKALLKECIRLKIISKNNSQIQATQDCFSKIRQLQLQNLHFTNQIKKIRTQNLKLKAQLYSLDHFDDSNFHNNFYKQVKNLSEECKFLDKRIDQLSKRQIWRKNSSFCNSTQQSKQIQRQKFRIMNNLKQNYQTQIDCLKRNLQDKDNEINRLKRTSQLGKRSNQSPRIKRPTYIKYAQKK